MKIIENRYDAIEPHVTGKTVLDIGCVDARPDGISKYKSTGLHIFLKDRASFLLGVDIDQEGTTQMVRDGYNVVCADAAYMNLDRRFDCIVAGEFIEHLSNPGLFLENMKQHLADDGILILTTPNAFAINNFFRILKKNRLKVHDEHQCWYDPITLMHLLKRHSFETKEVLLAHKSRSYLKKNRYKPKYLVPRLIARARPFFTSTIIIIAQHNDRADQTI